MINLLTHRIFTLFFTILFSGAAFAVSFFEEEILWEGGYNHYIKYEKQDSSSFGKNDHPTDLDEKNIIAALKSLEFKEKSFLYGETINSVFSFRQITLLGEYLAKGLKNAAPEQDIIFVLGGSSKSMLVLTKKSFIAGRVFYKEGKLNIIIGEYNLVRNEALEKVIDPSDRGNVNYSFNFGRRSSASYKFDGAIIGVPGIIQNNVEGKLRQDWIIIDVKLAAKIYIAKRKERENPNLKQDQALKIEAAKLAKQRREMRAEMARMRKEVQNISKKSSSAKSIEERMITLDELLAKKLITQEEYDKKRQEILSDI